MSGLIYFEEVNKLINKIKETQFQKIKKAARVFADKIKEDKIIHVLGTGHSHIIGIEMFARAGGLANINAMLDDNVITSVGARKGSRLERLSGLAEIIWDEYEIDNDDVMLIVSNSGRNSLPIEMALKAKEKGVYLIAITSFDHSKNCTSRHSSGKKLLDIADLTFDNCVPKGDSLLEFNGVNAVPGSTVSGVTIVNSIIAETLRILADESYPLPVYESQNVDTSNNEELYIKYRSRIKHI